MVAPPAVQRPETESTVLLVIVFALMSGMARRATPLGVGLAIAVLSVFAMAVIRRSTEVQDEQIGSKTVMRAVWLAVIAVVASSFLEARVPPGDMWNSFTIGWIALAAVSWITASRAPIRWRLVFMSILLVTGVQIGFTLSSHPSPAIDVWHLHNAGASSLSDGLSPYRSLDVLNTSPYVETGSTIDGYPYPPVAMVFYTLGSWIADARLASAFAWLTFLVTVSRLVLKRPDNLAVVGLFMLLAVQPGWSYVLALAWTEPITLMFLALALVNWDSRPKRSALYLGLALASKQYMVLLLPAALAATADRKKDRWSRIAIGGLLVTLPFMLWDLSGFWSSNVSFHLNTAPRPDSSNLVGLADLLGISWSTPTILAAGVPSLLAYLIVRGHAGRIRMALAAVVGTSAFFLLSSQAFANYWFLSASLIPVMLILDYTEVDAAARRTTG